MDATTKEAPTTRPYAGMEIGRGPQITRPSREKAEEAVRTLIAYAGDDPEREGLRETPRRVTSAYDEFFAGYGESPSKSCHGRSMRLPAMTISSCYAISSCTPIASTT